MARTRVPALAGAALALLAMGSSAAVASRGGDDDRDRDRDKSPTTQGPVAAPSTEPTSFADATARIGSNVTIGHGSYIGPFARLKTSKETSISIGNESNSQDSTTIDARKKSVVIGNKAILAHGASALNGASIGVEGSCPGTPAPASCGSFVSFNAVVDGGTLQKDAMVGALARVGPGVVIPSGRKVIPGKNVTSQAEVATETAQVVEADREFMNGVLHVNAAFAAEYPKLLADDPKAGTGINYDPGKSDFNPTRDLPTLHGKKVQDPGFRNRIIGDVHLEQSVEELDEVMEDKISLRADEGEPFHIGTIKKMEERTTFHALEHTHIETGNRGRFGERSIVHGGPNTLGGSKNLTLTGNNVRIGDGALFFNSHIGDNSRLGDRSVVQASDLKAGTIVPPRTIIVAGSVLGTVEW
jgi:carbonic anhydrase/acetyltransferase-like protein (isoleucine patch superfamily)